MGVLTSKRSLTCSIAIVVVDGNARLVNGELFKVGATVTVQLSVQVGKQTALQERVFSEVNTADNVTRLELFAVSLQIHSVIGSLIARSIP
jgi:hypothetical protein